MFDPKTTEFSAQSVLAHQSSDPRLAGTPTTTGKPRNIARRLAASSHVLGKQTVLALSVQLNSSLSMRDRYRLV